jgi:hypothetical protein
MITPAQITEWHTDAIQAYAVDDIEMVTTCPRRNFIAGYIRARTEQAAEAYGRKQALEEAVHIGHRSESSTYAEMNIRELIK